MINMTESMEYSRSLRYTHEKDSSILSPPYPTVRYTVRPHKLLSSFVDADQLHCDVDAKSDIFPRGGIVVMSANVTLCCM